MAEPQSPLPPEDDGEDGVFDSAMPAGAAGAAGADVSGGDADEKHQPVDADDGGEHSPMPDDDGAGADGAAAGSGPASVQGDGDADGDAQPDSAAPPGDDDGAGADGDGGYHAGATAGDDEPGAISAADVARERAELDRQMAQHHSPTGSGGRVRDDDKQHSPRDADDSFGAGAGAAGAGAGGGSGGSGGGGGGFNITIDRGAAAAAAAAGNAQLHAAYQKESDTYYASKQAAAAAIADSEQPRDDVSESDERNEQDLTAARAKRAALLKQNREFQQKIWLWLHDAKRNKQAGAGAGAGADAKQTETVNREQMKEQYKKTLEQLNTLWNRIEQTAEESSDQMLVLSADLKQADTKCRELNDAFKNFKRAIAREAKHSRNGKKIPFKEILHKETKEEEKDILVAEVRIKNIQLSNKLKQLQDQVKQKEELEQGLHLIDFEQLKIENQTLTEKIEERNDELHKLRKKTTTTVQVLTHIKEKLQFVENENEGLLQGLDGLEGRVGQLRDATTHAKKMREKLRVENAELKQKQGFIGSDALVADFEMRKGALEAVRERVAYLKARHARLSAVVQKAKQAEEMALQQLKARTRRPGLQTVGAAGSLTRPQRR